MTTKEKLMQALREAHAPEFMIRKAALGAYDDFESESVTPITDLVRDAHSNGLYSIGNRAMNGEFDATKEESEAWYEREGKNLLH
jgi:hypothetical protein